MLKYEKKQLLYQPDWLANTEAVCIYTQINERLSVKLIMK